MRFYTYTHVPDQSWMVTSYCDFSLYYFFSRLRSKFKSLIAN